MSNPNFTIPTRQSPKGIVVMLGFQLYNLIKKTWVFIPIALFSIFKKDDPNTVILKFAGITIIVLILLLLISFLKYRNFKFHFHNDYFVLQQGILKKEETSISTSKIQNVYIKQNLLQQIIDVVSLSVESAGDNKTEIEIKALDKSTAQALKALLISKNKKVTSPDMGAFSNEKSMVSDNETLFYRVTMKHLFLEGISENHLKSLAFIVAFLFGLYGNFKDFFEQMDLETLETSYFQYSESQVLQFLIFNVFILISLILLAFLISLVKTVLFNFDLKVVETDKGLEISKGLLNKVSLGLITSRIQTITLSTNRLKKALGLYQMYFSQAMVNAKQLKNFSIIGLSQSESSNLVDKFYKNILDGVVKHKPEPYFIRIKVIRWLLLVMAVNVFIVFMLPQIYLLLNLPALILIGFAVYQSYKKAYYSIDSEYLVVGYGGLVDINTDMAEIHKIQAVKLKQTIFQKYKGIASVKIYTASKPLTIPFVKESQARNLADFLLYKVESEDRHWM